MSPFCFPYVCVGLCGPLLVQEESQMNSTVEGEELQVLFHASKVGRTDVIQVCDRLLFPSLTFLVCN
jgi:hypothetical protein